MRRFLLKPRSGNHVERDKKGKLVTYKAGDTVPSDRDLVALFPDKFELSSGQDSRKVATAPDIPESSKKKKKVTAEETASKKVEIPESGYGVDVTEEFPTASKVKLKVFEKSKWFTVVDPENDEVMNEKKLRKDKVEDFLKEYLQDDDEDNEDGDNDDEDTDDEDDDDDDDEED